MAYIYDIADTWAASGTVFTGIKLNVTDTASAAGSLLMDLQVGGVSRFSVSKTGAVTTPGSLNAGVDIYWTRDLYALSSTARITWTGGLSLHQDAANTLAQRNGVNAQEVRVYKTYTDAANFERVGVGDIPSITGNNGLYFGRAGTGLARNLYIFNESNSGIIFGTNANVRWQVTSAGTFGAWVDNTLDIGNVSDQRPRNVFIAGYNQLSEMTAPAAPAANGVRIYAEDDGAGKTRLMARFATGAAVQIAIEP